MPLSAFHPAVRAWFERNLGEATRPQREGWPRIRAGAHVLIAAPTGTGKTLAAFLTAIDALAQQGPYLADQCQVLYISPLKALGNDIQKNLQVPLAGIRAEDAFVPDIRVMVRSGDTTAADRAKMLRKPPHILVTTPESLYILLTSVGGRGLLRSVRTVIIDEIHALAGDKRGAHLALSLERLVALAGEVQRIGLSATQKPLADIAHFLVGVGRTCEVVDAGHLRHLDLAVEIPSSPLEAVCAHEVWAEIYERIAALIAAHRTTLVFVNTRKLAERISARLGERIGAERIACHHGSLSKERRLDAEQRLKEGRLAALVATASLELGIDIGDVDLVVQISSPRAIATFLQRVGRAGHGVHRTPKGRLFPLTIDELAEGAALLRAVKNGELDRIPQPRRPLDILAQQVVAACVAETWDEDGLHRALTRAWPYRDLSREDFAQVVALHTAGRLSLLHRDGVNHRLRATRRARLVAVTAGGAIPETAAFAVREEPEDALVGTLDEDFSIESNPGDIFQLGNTSWRILRIESRAGVVRVVNAHGAPPTIPFWFGEAPGRTRELSAAVGALRRECDGVAWLVAETGLSPAGAEQLWEYLESGRRALGCLPTDRRVVAERFFDESGGSQVVIHAPFGARLNRAWALALRKRFCRHFGFELEAAANEDALILSLSPNTSFKLDEIFSFLAPATVRDVLAQACITGGQFETRWRWNVTRALLVERFSGGRKVPAYLLRLRANDAMAAAFPQVTTCAENLPAGPIEVPDHPLVAQTVADCLGELLDADGLVEVLAAMRRGDIATSAVETPEASPLAGGILAAQPYAFLDDVPLEERRVRAVAPRGADPAAVAGHVGELDAEAVQRVREEAWPQPRDSEEVHEALLWMGYVTTAEAPTWRPWLEQLLAAGRVTHDDDRWFAIEATRDAVEVMRGRLEALGPMVSDDPTLLALENQGIAIRTRLDGRAAWCHRRLLARIHRYMLERLRRAVEPESAATFLRFLACWQGADPDYRRDGPRGVAETLAQLAGFEIPVAAWEAKVLPSRVRGYRPEWLDQVMYTGEFTWGRLWSAPNPGADGRRVGAIAARLVPLCIVPRASRDAWLALAPACDLSGLSGNASVVQRALSEGGAQFPQDLAKTARLLPEHFEMALGELVARGLATCDSFAALRWLQLPSRRRAEARAPGGRWSLFRPTVVAAPAETPQISGAAREEQALLVVRQLLARVGVVFRMAVLRERHPLSWRDCLFALRTLELRGEVRGGRFVAGFSGEQYALPEAAALLRQVAKRPPREAVQVSASDPLNFTGILTPEERVRPTVRAWVRVG